MADEGRGEGEGSVGVAVASPCCAPENLGGLMAYHFYENWTAEGHRATVHVGECSFCNNGSGIHPDASERNGRWSTPFDSLAEARQAAGQAGATVRSCGKCVPR